jgi:hypothetical protein
MDLEKLACDGACMLVFPDNLTKMKYITKFLKSFQPHETKRVLGRWSVINSEKQISYKVDLSNEDHCGTCANYILEKRGPNVKEDVTQKNTEEAMDDEYYRYLML